MGDQEGNQVQNGQQNTNDLLRAFMAEVRERFNTLETRINHEGDQPVDNNQRLVLGGNNRRQPQRIDPQEVQ